MTDENPHFARNPASLASNMAASALKGSDDRVSSLDTALQTLVPMLELTVSLAMLG